MKKPKIKIVAGLVYDVEFFSIFESLADEFDLEALLLDDSLLLSKFKSSIPVKVFTEVADMPGYMRSLEQNLGDADLIICLESSRLSSFQGLRAGLKHQIPCLIFSTETKAHKYAEFANILAIQEEIYKRAHKIVGLSSAACQKLLVEGVLKDRILSLPLSSCPEKFCFSEKKREKFRNHVEIDAQEILVTIKSDLTEDAYLEEHLKALSALNKKMPSAQKLRVIISGDGPLCKDLQYLAFDLGLGKQVLFLRQDIDPFALDLYCASDYMVAIETSDPGLVNVYPRWLLDSMLCKAVPVVSPQSDGHNLLGEKAIVIESRHQKLYEFYKNILLHKKDLNHQAQEAFAFALENHSHKVVAPLWRQLLRETLSSAAKTQLPSFKKTADHIEKDILEKNYHSALEGIETLYDTCPLAMRAKVHQLKGDALWGLNELNLAMDAYKDSVELDPRNTRSFIGLGQIALRSQAFQDAYAFFKKAISCKPNSPEACLGIGLVHRSLSMPSESSYWLLKCLRLERKNPRALLVLTQLAGEFEDPSDAIECLERGREVVGEEPSLMLALGKLYLKQGSSEIGHDLIEKAGILLK